MVVSIPMNNSPTYSQSNGLAERAVRYAKKLLEKCHRDTSDIFLAVLHTRDTTKDKLPSPAQRPMSRSLRSTIQITGERLKPAVQIHVHNTVLKKRQQNNYDKSANNLPELYQGDTVRLQISKGDERNGRVEGPTSDPRSYKVISEAVCYCRNRMQLLKVPEPYNYDDVLYHYNAPVTNEHVNQNPVNLNKGHSRIGRVYKPNPKYSEYGVLDSIGLLDVILYIMFR